MHFDLLPICRWKRRCPWDLLPVAGVCATRFGSLQCFWLFELIVTLNIFATFEIFWQIHSKPPFHLRPSIQTVFDQMGKYHTLDEQTSVQTFNVICSVVVMEEVNHFTHRFIQFKQFNTLSLSLFLVCCFSRFKSPYHAWLRLWHQH